MRRLRDAEGWPAATVARVERANFAGFGAGRALLGAAGIAAAVLLAFVAFNGSSRLGGGGGGEPPAPTAEQGVAPSPGSAAATTLASAPGAVAATPTRVLLANHGNPSSVITPGSAGGGGNQFRPGGTDTTAVPGTIPASGPGSSLIGPLSTAIETTVHQVISLTAVPQLATSLCTTVGATCSGLNLVTTASAARGAPGRVTILGLNVGAP